MKSWKKKIKRRKGSEKDKKIRRGKSKKTRFLVYIKMIKGRRGWKVLLKIGAVIKMKDDVKKMMEL